MAGYCGKHKVFYEGGCPCCDRCLCDFGDVCNKIIDHEGKKYSKRYYKKYHEVTDQVTKILFDDEDEKYGSTTENPHGRRRAMYAKHNDENERTTKYDNRTLSYLNAFFDTPSKREVVNKKKNEVRKPVETEKDMENWLGAALTHLGNIDSDSDYDVDVENYANAGISSNLKGLLIKVDGHKFMLDITLDTREVL